MIHRELRARPVLAALLLLGAAACAAPASTADGTANGPGTNPGTNPGGDPGSDPGGDPGTCDISTPAETFVAGDAPASSNGFSTPWGYARSANSARKYPVVVNGCWAEGSYFSTTIRQKYPAFYLDWNNHCSSDQDGVDLAAVIDKGISAGLRIDTNRIYLTGFSQGGSGSYKILRGMIASGKNIAGLIRVAGQSESVLPDESVAKTGVWYHIGLKDDAARIQVANDAYAYVKNDAPNASAVETTVTDTAGSWARTTKTLTKNGIAIFRLSSYPAGAHDPAPAYALPQDASLNVFDWLFAQSLACR